MPNFVRVKPAGWAANEKLDAAQMNQLDIDHAKSVNGDGGGSYNGALTWNGNHNFSSAVIHDGTVELNDGVTLSALLTLAAGAGFRFRVGTIGDAAATCDVSKDIYHASTLCLANRIITLRSTTAPVPSEGEVIRFANHIGTGVGAVDWIFQREDATELGRIKQSLNTALGFISFVFTGGVWVGFEQGGSGLFTSH